MAAIHEMDLFDEIYMECSNGMATCIMRVPGGWIFRFQNSSPHSCTCFVPYRGAGQDAQGIAGIDYLPA